MKSIEREREAERERDRERERESDRERDRTETDTEQYTQVHISSKITTERHRTVQTQNSTSQRRAEAYQDEKCIEAEEAGKRGGKR